MKNEPWFDFLKNFFLIKNMTQEQISLSTVLVGGTGTGKSSFILRLTHNVFADEYFSKKGMSICCHNVDFNGRKFGLRFCDIAGDQLYDQSWQEI
jgi:GTPase SAR1 family protein